MKFKHYSRCVDELLMSVFCIPDTINTQCIEKPSRWALHALTPLKIYAAGRVALIGDAVSFSYWQDLIHRTLPLYVIRRTR